jgi:hypothetical protein
MVSPSPQDLAKKLLITCKQIHATAVIENFEEAK